MLTLYLLSLQQLNTGIINIVFDIFGKLQKTGMQLNSFKQKYTILQKIEEGSYGIIYKARNNQSKEIVAVKKFKSLNKVGLPISFVRERYIFQILKGNHLVKVIETFIGEEEPMMVMEWLATNLDKIVASKKKFAVKEIFQQILRGVQEFHKNDLIHRDLKPSNIMLSPKNQHLVSQPEPADIDTLNYNVKIIDYGMAKELDFQEKPMTNMVGSLFYRAPELLLGSRKYGKQVDIWALGCIFHYMVTGNILFKGESQANQFKKVIQIVGIQKNNIKNHYMSDSLEKLKIEDRNQNWSESLKLMNQIEFEFLSKMIVVDPDNRLNCRQLLNDEYFT